MVVTDSQLNRHERDIIQAIETSMPNGIHVQGLVKKNGLSPTTLKKYLPVLENEYRVIYHEKIKNKDVYRIRFSNEPTFDESEKMNSRSVADVRSTIIGAIIKSTNFGIAERIEVYHHAITVLALLRYTHQLAIDVGYDVKEIPSNITKYMNEIDRISQNVNTVMDPFTRSFYITQLDHTISESLEFLKNTEKARKGKPSKHIKIVLNKIKSDAPEVFDKVVKIDNLLKNSTREIKKFNKTKARH